MMSEELRRAAQDTIDYSDDYGTGRQDWPEWNKKIDALKAALADTKITGSCSSVKSTPEQTPPLTTCNCRFGSKMHVHQFCLHQAYTDSIRGLEERSKVAALLKAACDVLGSDRMIDLNKIEAAAKAATPGPWEADGPSFGEPLPKYLDCVGFVTEDDEFNNVCTKASCLTHVESTANMNFIATSNPSAVLEMISMIRYRNDALKLALQAVTDNFVNLAGEQVDSLRKAVTAINEVLG
jgi:hypothetical protein